MLSVMLIISLTGFSQEITADKVPVPVKQAFAKKFPAATDVKYEMEMKDYEINFKIKETKYSANFDAKGKWLETETAIRAADLPKEVSGFVAKNFTGFKIVEVSRLETPEMKRCYELDLKSGTEGFEVRFSEKGDILKKVALKEDTEE